jgi:Uma2 family endonuclease
MSTAIALPPIQVAPAIAAPVPTPAPATTPPPQDPDPFGGMRWIRKFTVEEYHRMIEAKILTDRDPIELLEGYLVIKMPHSPAHDYAISTLYKRLSRLIPDTFFLQSQCAATFATSEPEPDFTIARGPETDYRNRYPGPSDTACIIEVSVSSLIRDRNEKAGIYARGGIPIYWVVNVDARTIEVYSEPSGSAYGQRTEYAVGASVPVILDGKSFGEIAVADVMA